MHRPKEHRSTWRLFAWGLTVVVYGIVLAFAADMSSASAAGGSGPGVPAQQAMAGATVADAAMAAVEEDVAESPLITLGLAGVVVALFGLWRLGRMVRRPRPQPMAVRTLPRRVTTPG